MISSAIKHIFGKNAAGNVVGSSASGVNLFSVSSAEASAAGSVGMSAAGFGALGGFGINPQDVALSFGARNLLSSAADVGLASRGVMGAGVVGAGLALAYYDGKNKQENIEKYSELANHYDNHLDARPDDGRVTRAINLFSGAVDVSNKDDLAMVMRIAKGIMVEERVKANRGGVSYSGSLDTNLDIYGDEAVKYPDILERSKKDKNKDKYKSSGQKHSAISMTGAPMPDPDDWEPEEEEKEGEKFKWEVKEPKDADKIQRHERFGKFYKDPHQKIEGKNLWWTKDRARHGGSYYKVYKESKKGLEHYADLDEFGNVIPKHKSDVGLKISNKELIGIK